MLQGRRWSAQTGISTFARDTCLRAVAATLQHGASATEESEMPTAQSSNGT